MPAGVGVDRLLGSAGSEGPHCVTGGKRHKAGVLASDSRRSVVVAINSPCVVRQEDPKPRCQARIRMTSNVPSRLAFLRGSASPSCAGHGADVGVDDSARPQRTVAPAIRSHCGAKRRTACPEAWLTADQY